MSETFAYSRAHNILYIFYEYWSAKLVFSYTYLGTTVIHAFFFINNAAWIFFSNITFSKTHFWFICVYASIYLLDMYFRVTDIDLYMVIDDLTWIVCQNPWNYCKIREIWAKYMHFKIFENKQRPKQRWSWKWPKMLNNAEAEVESERCL